MTYKPYDPATSHGDPKYGPVFGCTEPCCAGATPGGNSTITWANEKSVQEWNNCNVIARNTNAALGSDHDKYAQGIYETDPMTGARDYDD